VIVADDTVVFATVNVAEMPRYVDGVAAVVVAVVGDSKAVPSYSVDPLDQTKRSPVYRL